MSSKAEVKGSDKPKDKERQTAGKDAKPQEKRDGAKPKAEQTETKRKDEVKTDKAPADAKEKTERPQTEKRERKEGDRKPREPREPREPRQPREPKGEKTEGAEGEKKDSKPRGERRPRTEGAEGEKKRERKERPKREYDPDWKKKIEVTLETEIPALPAEKDRLQKPNSEALANNLKECDRKIKEYEDEIKNQQNKREDWRKKEKEKREQERLLRAENRQNKEKEWEDNKVLFEDHNVLKKEVEKISKEKKDVEDKLEAIQSKIFDLEKQFLTKSAMSLDDVKYQISSLEDRMMNERMTGIEEKKLIQDLTILKKSIPVAEQYSKLMVEKKKIRDERKLVVDRLAPLLNQKKELGKDIKVIIEKRKADEEANPKKKEENDKKKEAEKEKKEEEKKERPKSDDPFSKRIEELITHKKEMYKKKDKLKQEFDDQWEKYHVQKEEIRRIEYMISQKEYLKRIEDIKERKAKELRDQLIQEYLVENTPKEDAATFYKEEISACDLLTNYLTSILPSNRKLLQLEKLDDDISIKLDDIQSHLKSDKKLSGLKPAPIKEQIVYSQGNKKKHQKKSKPETKEAEKKPEVVEEDFDPEAKIILDIQIRNAFSQINIDAPVFNKDVEPSIEAVEKKKVELEQLVKSKAEEIANIRKNAESSVPTLAELKERFKDAPIKEKGEKGTHGHKERRGTRGGRRGGDRTERENTDFRGPRDRHPRREGDQEKADAEEQQYEDEDSYEVQRRNAEKARHVPKKGPILESDFPAL